MKRLGALLLAIASLASMSLGIAARPANAFTPPPAASAAADVVVWVNLSTGVYHYPGTRWYGKTKHGAYMKESVAIKDGYRAAENGQ